MIFEALIAAAGISLISLVGAFFFGNSKGLVGIERYAIPAAVGVFLSLALIDLIPETIKSAPTLGGIVIGIGFIAFYILSSFLHKRFHNHADEDCDKKGAAMLVLIGDAIHNLSDGFILGGAFLINPAAGVGVAIGLALHEVPQEIVEFGVLVRAGYSRKKAALLNLLSASTIIVGTLIILFIAKQAEAYVWVLSAFAAGNLLYLAAGDLLPRIHGDVKQYGSVWRSTLAIVIGFIIMTSVITVAHERTHTDHHDENEVH